MPRTDEDKDQDDSTLIVTVPGGTETILLVEDEEMVRVLAKSILEHYGYKVIVASNGEEGLNICRDSKESIDLLITDVVMPQMGGRELSEQVLDIRPETKVLFMSGYANDAIVRHGVLADNLSFIQKPFLPDTLAAKTREVLDRSA